MGKGGVGVGSASMVLVFAVLCLTIFSLITLVVSSNDKALVDVQVELVSGYYGADTLATRILADILAADTIPDNVRGVDIHTGWDEELNAETTYYYCRISDVKTLYVNLIFHDDSYDILSWRMWDTDEWEFDDSLNVWSGD